MGCCNGVVQLGAVHTNEGKRKHILVICLESLIVHVPLQGSSLVRVKCDVNLLGSRWWTYWRVREEWNGLVQRILPIKH